MDSIITQIHALAQSTDEDGRREVQRAVRQLQLDLRSPQQVLFDMGNANLLIAMIRLGTDLGIFRDLTHHRSPRTIAELGKAEEASPELIERVLRFLAANGTVKQIESDGANEYQANSVTYVLADSRGEGMTYHGFDTFGPTVQATPDFFAENKYQDITSNTNTPFQKAFNTELRCFDWLVQHPKHFGSLQKLMSALEGAEWTVGFELLDTEANKVSSTAPQASEKAFFVDVGGGHGHQCVQLGKIYPHLLGRLFLQDLPQAIDQLPAIEGVNAQAHDFFQKQPIVGAKFYYLRRIIHDWPDNEAVAILENLRGALTPDSRILIDDVVLPDTGASWMAVMNDISMMIAFGGKERTKKEWHALADRAGLRVEQFHTYLAASYTTITVLALK